MIIAGQVPVGRIRPVKAEAHDPRRDRGERPRTRRPAPTAQARRSRSFARKIPAPNSSSAPGSCITRMNSRTGS